MLRTPLKAMCSVLCNCPGDLRHNSGPLCTLHSSYTSAACSAGLFYCIGQKRHVRHTAVQEMHGLNAATLLVALHISSCTVLNTFAKDCISLALGYYSSSAHELLQTLAHLFAIYGSFCKACNQQAASSWQGTFLHKCMPCHLHSLAHINPHTEVCNGHAVSCLPTVRQGTLHGLNVGFHVQAHHGHIGSYLHKACRVSVRVHAGRCLAWRN